MSDFRVSGGGLGELLPGLHILSRREERDAIHLTAETTSLPVACVKCGVVGEFTGIGRLKQPVRDTSLHGLPVVIELQRRRFKCRACNQTFLEPLDWLHEERRMTRRLVAAITRDALRSTNTHTARTHGVDEKTVRNILDAHFATQEEQLTLYSPVYLGIDEIHVAGRARAIFTDITNRLILEMLPDNRKGTIAAFLRALPERDRTKAVAIDMTRYYADLANEFFPGAVVVADRFHVNRLANDAVDAYRRHLRKSASKALLRNLRSERYVLLTRRRDLTPMRLREIEEVWLKDFPDLVRAYDLKEQFFDIYAARTAEHAKRKLDAWRGAIPAELKPFFKPVVTASKNWEKEILAFFEYPITNAYTESMNRVVRDVDRVGRGHTFEGLRAKILFGQKDRSVPKRTTVRRVKRKMLMTDMLLNLPDFHLGKWAMVESTWAANVPDQGRQWVTVELAQNVLEAIVNTPKDQDGSTPSEDD